MADDVRQLTPADLDRLEAAARANNGEMWEIGPAPYFEVTDPTGRPIQHAWFAQHAAHIATADPQTVLALVERVREVNRLLESLTWAVGFIRCNFPHTVAPYPDYRNACDLLAKAGGGIVTGEFQRAMARAELAEGERDRLAAAIRAHRDQRGDDRCWLDDESLYAALPEGHTPPARDAKVEIDNCIRYISTRRRPGTVYVSPQRRIEELEAERDRLAAENAGLRQALRDLTATAEESIELQLTLDRLRAARGTPT